MKRYTICFLALVIFVAVLGANMAFGEVNENEYGVEHNLRLKPGGNVIPLVGIRYYTYARVWERGPSNSDKDKQTGKVLIPAGGGNGTRTAFAQGACKSSAKANSSWNVAPFAAGTPVIVTIKSDGKAIAIADPPPISAFAHARSWTKVYARGGQELRNGRIRWGRVIKDKVSGSASAFAGKRRRSWDPITFEVFDPVTLTTVQDTLLSIEWHVLKEGPGGIDWDGDIVDLDAQDAEFIVNLSSPYSVEQGYLRLKIENGEVVISDDSGIFEATLPPVGANIPLTFGLANETEFDYDLGDFDDHDITVTLDFGGDGEGLVTAGVTIPTLTEWGMIIMFVIMAAGVVWFVVRNRRRMVTA